MGPAELVARLDEPLPLEVPIAVTQLPETQTSEARQPEGHVPSDSPLLLDELEAVDPVVQLHALKFASASHTCAPA